MLINSFFCCVGLLVRCYSADRTHTDTHMESIWACILCSSIFVTRQNLGPWFNGELMRDVPNSQRLGNTPLCKPSSPSTENYTWFDLLINFSSVFLQKNNIVQDVALAHIKLTMQSAAFNFRPKRRIFMKLSRVIEANDLTDVWYPFDFDMLTLSNKRSFFFEWMRDKRWMWQHPFLGYVRQTPYIHASFV